LGVRVLTLDLRDI